MSEDRHSEISDLYQQSSQEKPAAQVDQAVMEQARKSVRRRAFSPFGNRWFAGGAVAVVAVMSVLLIQMVSQQADLSVPARDAMAPLRDLLSGGEKESARGDAVASDPPLTAEQLQQARVALKTRFLDREELQALEANVREQESRTRMQQPAVLAVEDSASTGVIPDKKVTVSEQLALQPMKQSPTLAGENSASTEKMPGEEVIVSEQVATPALKQSPTLAGENAASTEKIPGGEVIVSEQVTTPALKQPSALAVEDSAGTGAVPDKKVIISEQVAQPPLKQASALTGEEAVGATALAPPLAKSEHTDTAAKAPVLAAEASASATATAPTGKYYLQAGSFRTTVRANRLKTELAELGFISDIKAARIEGRGIYYRVRVGPFADRETLAESRQKLGKLGIETRTLTDRK